MAPIVAKPEAALATTKMPRLPLGCQIRQVVPLGSNGTPVAVTQVTMTTLLAQAPTLQLFAPVLVTAGLALALMVLGRVVATRKFKRAAAASARWRPTLETPTIDTEHPLNQVQRRRVTLTELISASVDSLDLSNSELSSPA